MKSWVYIQSVLFALLGIGLVYLTFSKVSFQELIEVIKTGNFWVLIPVFFVSISVVFLRVWRWSLLYKHGGLPIKANALFFSLNIGYLVNFAVPRLGEITRALILKKSDDVPINQSISTIVFERLADMLALFLVVLSAFVFELIFGNGLLSHFTKDMDLHPGSKLIFLLLALLIGILFLYLIYRFRSKFGFWFSELMENFLHLFTIPERFSFILSTFLIWFGFYLMTYLWVFMFPASANLGMYPCFQVMVLGVIARTLPIQAGSAGAYHYVVSTAFILLGTDQNTAGALALVIHGFQSILTLLLGLISYICFLYLGSKK
ncbi:MAG: lysylphosphatidylglycerol synthase transmembrane domain-containing protein [Bacteroidia bacterium]